MRRRARSSYEDHAVVVDVGARGPGDHQIAQRREKRVAVVVREHALGFEAELERTYISMLELGQRQPTLTTLYKLSIPLKTSASDMVEMLDVELRRQTRKPTRRSVA